MSSLQRRTDNLILFYLMVTTAFALLFRSQMPAVALIVSLHLVVSSGIYCLRFLPEKLPSGPGFLRDWYPAIAFPILYKEVELFAGAFGNWGLTESVQMLEASTFGGHPSMFLSERLASLPLSEYLHFCYFAYLLLFPVIGGYWYFTGQKKAFRELLFLMCVTYSFSYLFFMLFPVDSPFYLSPPLAQPLSGGLFYNLVHFLAERGGARGGAFPSSHVSVATVVWLVVWRYQPRLAYGILPIVVGLVIATVYGRFHYTLDSIAGFLLGVSIVATYVYTERARTPPLPAAP